MVRGQLGWTRGSLAPGARATYSFSPDAGERGSVATSIGPTADGDSADPATGEGSITVTSGK